MKWKCAKASFILFANWPPLFFQYTKTGQTNQKDLSSFLAGVWERKHMILPGSKEIVLNAGSIIKFFKDFLIGLERLIGEAIFETTIFGKAAITLQTPLGDKLLFDNDSQKGNRFTANFDLKEDLDKVFIATTKFNAISLRDENRNFYYK